MPKVSSFLHRCMQSIAFCSLNCYFTMWSKWFPCSDPLGDPLGFQMILKDLENEGEFSHYLQNWRRRLTTWDEHLGNLHIWPKLEALSDSWKKVCEEAESVSFQNIWNISGKPPMFSWIGIYICIFLFTSIGLEIAQELGTQEMLKSGLEASEKQRTTRIIWKTCGGFWVGFFWGGFCLVFVFLFFFFFFSPWNY